MVKELASNLCNPLPQQRSQRAIAHTPVLTFLQSFGNQLLIGSVVMAIDFYFLSIGIGAIS
jgi:hypothetical protein